MRTHAVVVNRYRGPGGGLRISRKEAFRLNEDWGLKEEHPL